MTAGAENSGDILVVDDTPDSLRVLVKILSEHGYSVRAATNGGRALASVAKARPDLILLDVQMPDMDGYEVCRRLQEDPQTRSIPVLFISSMDEALDKLRAFREGAVDYITKPIHEGEVLARIESQMTILRQRRQLMESLALISSVMDSSLDGIMAYRAARDEQGKIQDFHWTMVNPAAAKMVGHSAQALLGQALLRYFPVIQETGIFEDYVKVVETGASLDKEVFLEGAWIHMVGVQLGDGLAVTFRDTTERKAMELSLARQANRDGLTDLANRRAFDDSLEREWKRCARTQQPLALIMVDVDYFKNFNDSQGHLGGDDCLKKIGAAIQRALKRPGDMAARYGGEEFAVILSETDAEGALTVARAITGEVESLALPHPASPLGKISLSQGIACQVPQAGEGPTGLVALADQALYTSKKSGRNQVQLSLSQGITA